MSQIIKLYQTLFIFQKSAQTISTLTKFIYDKQLEEKMADNESDNLMMTMINHVILETNIFLEEYNERFGKYNNPELDLRIRGIKEICRPIIRRINKWKGLKDYRNEIIAHPWYSKGEKFTLPGSKRYNVPTRWIDVIVLAIFIEQTYAIIYTDFRKESDEALGYLLSGYETLPLIPDNLDSINADIKILETEVNDLCSKNRKNYRIKIDEIKRLGK
jgi:hypothetical protein